MPCRNGKKRSDLESRSKKGRQGFCLLSICVVLTFIMIFTIVGSFFSVLSAAETEGEEAPDGPREDWFNTVIEAFEESARQPDKEWTSGQLVFAVCTRLLLAAILGGVIAVVYAKTYTGKRGKRVSSMIQTQVMLCVAGSLIWIVVGNNIVRAFGLAGALGLIRYRTVMKDPKDTTIVLLSMIIGMACGLGQYLMASISTILVCLVLTGLWIGAKEKRPAASSQRAEDPDAVKDDSK